MRKTFNLKNIYNTVSEDYMNIRQEHPSDYDEVYELVKKSFATSLGNVLGFRSNKMIMGVYMGKIFIAIGLFLLICVPIYSENVKMSIDNCELSGSLEIPDSKKPTSIVIIVPGSGPTDRNGNNPLGVNSNAYKLLADQLLKNGIASLRYDKRGIGSSDNGGISEDHLTFDAMIDDLAGWINYVKSRNQFNKIYVIGHSEGSLISIITLEKVKCDGFISIAGPGKKASAIIMEQLKSNPNNPAEILNTSQSIINKLLKGKREENVPPVLDVLFRKSVQPYLISWFKYDPAVEIKKIDCPVLLIHGSQDIQVPIENAEILSKAKRKSGLMKIEGMTHTLKIITRPEDQIISYTDPSIPVAEELVSGICNFINGTE